jgi:hypothetical protein
MHICIYAYADEVDAFMHLYLHIQGMYRVLQYVQGNIHITAGLVLRGEYVCTPLVFSDLVSDIAPFLILVIFSVTLVF